MDTIVRIAENPAYQSVREDGRFRRWGYSESWEHWVRVIVEPDGETLHNAFIDSTFDPEQRNRFGAEDD